MVSPPDRSFGATLNLTVMESLTLGFVVLSIAMKGKSNEGHEQPNGPQQVRRQDRVYSTSTNQLDVSMNIFWHCYDNCLQAACFSSPSLVSFADCLLAIIDRDMQETMIFHSCVRACVCVQGILSYLTCHTYICVVGLAAIVYALSPCPPAPCIFVDV